MNHSMPGLSVHHQLPEFTQTHVHRVSDAIQPSHSLSSPSPLALQSLPASQSFPMSQPFAWGVLPWPGIKAIILGEELAFAANIRKLPAFWMLCSAHLLGCPSPIQGFFDTNFTALPVGLVFLLECALDYPLSCPYWVKLQFQTLLSLSFALWLPGLCSRIWQQISTKKHHKMASSMQILSHSDGLEIYPDAHWGLHLLSQGGVLLSLSE